MNASSAPNRVNWRQASAEVVLIMIGILAALAADSWWDERSERKDEINYLTALRADFMTNRESLLVQIEEEEQYLKHGERILSYIRSEQPTLTSDEVTESLRGFLWLTNWTPTTGTYDELVGSGRLSYLQSDEIRVTLATFRHLVEQFGSYREDQNSSYFAIFAPFLHRNLNMEILGWIGNDAPRSPFPFDVEDLRSRTFWNLTVEWMALHDAALNGAYGLRELLAQTDEILKIIDARLTETSG